MLLLLVRAAGTSPSPMPLAPRGDRTELTKNCSLSSCRVPLGSVAEASYGVFECILMRPWVSKSLSQVDHCTTDGSCDGITVPSVFRRIPAGLAVMALEARPRFSGAGRLFLSLAIVQLGGERQSHIPGM